jgi:Domain of unknown function (DUF6471)
MSSHRYARTEREWAERAAVYLKVELKRADLTYEKLAEQLRSYGFIETRASISNKLSRATVPASFFLACLAVIGLDVVKLEDI